MIHLLFALALCAGCSGEPIIRPTVICVTRDESTQTAAVLCGQVARTGPEMEACHRALFVPGAKVAVRTCGTISTLTAGAWSAEFR